MKNKLIETGIDIFIMGYLVPLFLVIMATGYEYPIISVSFTFIPYIWIIFRLKLIKKLFLRVSTLSKKLCNKLTVIQKIIIMPIPIAVLLISLFATLALSAYIDYEANYLRRNYLILNNICLALSIYTLPISIISSIIMPANSIMFIFLLWGKKNIDN